MTWMPQHTREVCWLILRTAFCAQAISYACEWTVHSSPDGSENYLLLLCAHSVWQGSAPEATRPPRCLPQIWD